MYRRRRPKSKRFIRFVFFLFISMLLIFAVSRSKKTTEIISPLAVSSTLPTSTEKINKPIFKILSKSKKPAELKTAIKTVADEKWKNYSVLIRDLNSDFSMELNETAIYDAASVNKVPILATLYHEASNGNINLSKSITIQAKDIQDYGTGSIRYDPPGKVYSVKTLANLMIKKSDNTAAYILANYILTLTEIQSYIENLGLTQTDMINNTTSNKDMGILFSQIFKGTVANAALTKEMIGLLKDTDFEDRLPAKLPDGVTVYHKIGTGIGAVHDIGVVERDTIKYYIGIFTSDVVDEERTSEEVADVSHAVYEFMQ